ncbi:helix-turn-helix transcriptional regulator [Leptothoe sp. ISB3NOV94-8A]|nr:helix-turn-helix transcriptional regulator [Leptothoe sp. LEGE 181152]
MNFSEAFDLTLKEFGLTGKSLAISTGLREATVSNFRNGSDIRSDNLEKLLSALPPEAKQFLFLKVFVDDLNPDGIATMLGLLAGRLKETQSSPEYIEKSVIPQSPVSV